MNWKKEGLQKKMKLFKTPLANDIDAADEKIKYDAQVKKVLANKSILAWIHL